MNLLKISVDDMQNFLKDRRRLARKAPREFLIFLRQVFDSAIGDNKMPSNPARIKKLRNPSDKLTAREALPPEAAVIAQACGAARCWDSVGTT